MQCLGDKCLRKEILGNIITDRNPKTHNTAGLRVLRYIAGNCVYHTSQR